MPITLLSRALTLAIAGVVLALVAGLLAVGRAPVAHAAVLNIADGDVTGLIAAINTANGNGEADTINLAPGGTYTLTAVDNCSTCFGDNGLPVISSDITINGSGATIERSAAGDTPAFRIFCVSASGSLSLNDMTVENGFAAQGGGLSNTDGALTLTKVTVSGNTAPAAGCCGTSGGGIFNSGSLTLVDSTITGNTATCLGGGIANRASATLTNTTVSGNIATSCGGGGVSNVFGATLTLNNSTVTDNAGGPGGGIALFSGTMTLKNTIVANNMAGGGCSLFVASTSLGHNLSSDGTCGFTATGDLQNTDPMLGPLADNGGPTLTHALLVGSPAIDAASPDCLPPAADQRGVARPQGAACDIGAFELVTTIEVAIDIKPGSFPNSINPQSQGAIPVVIVTTDGIDKTTFDATTVDPSTVRFGRTGTEAAPVHFAFEDVDLDGDIDMILHFNTQDMGIMCGDTSASLRGQTFNRQAVQGSDSIRTVGCRRP